MIVLGALGACFLWPIWALFRWKGIWRALAGAPVIAVILWTLKIWRDLSLDPTSHNLLPFEYIIMAVIAAPYMAVVCGFRLIVNARIGRS
jgi:hypothetical protein